ncbi:MAG: sodium/proline symporter [Clostridia bacterium]|nr:sodium/proline symporter [Clostridia bacterium]
MNMNDILIMVAIVLYLAFMIAVGVVTSKKNKSSDDFYLGGRKLGPFVTAMSAEASDMSGWLLMGLPGLALMTGLAEAVWTAVGLSIGTYVNWLIVAKRLRVYSEKINAVTLPEFFSKRFADSSNILSVIAALVIIIFFIPYTASGFSACGKLFGTLFNMDYHLAMTLSAAVIVLYCTLGGFLAASTTDFVQSIVMTVALVTVVGLGAGAVNGFGSVFNNVSGLDGYLDIFKGFSVADNTTGTYGFLTIVSTLAWGLGYFGMPHILLRFMAIRDPAKLKTSRRVASVWVVISMGVAILIGVVGYSLMKADIVPTYESASAAETIIVDISKYISLKNGFFAFLAGIFLSGILASTMSTADSQLIAASSSVTQDILVDSMNLKLSEKKVMLIARVSVIVIALIAIVFAWDPASSVFRIVSFAWAGFGAAFGPVILIGLFWKKANRFGALAGMVAGGAMIFIWKFGIAKLGGAFAIYELLPAFICGAVAMIVVSLLTGAPDKEVEETFDSIHAALKE